MAPALWGVPAALVTPHGRGARNPTVEGVIDDALAGHGVLVYSFLSPAGRAPADGYARLTARARDAGQRGQWWSAPGGRFAAALPRIRDVVTPNLAEARASCSGAPTRRSRRPRTRASGRSRATRDWCAAAPARRLSRRRPPARHSWRRRARVDRGAARGCGPIGAGDVLKAGSPGAGARRAGARRGARRGRGGRERGGAARRRARSPAHAGAAREDGGMTRPRPTMRHVAERAGVSLKTVSRVINDEPNVARRPPSASTRRSPSSASAATTWRARCATGVRRRRSGS